MKKLLVVLGAMMALVALNGNQAQAVVVSVNPLQTFLRTNSDPASSAVALNLGTLGFSAGDSLVLTRLGDFRPHSTSPNSLTGMLGLFSSTGTILGASLLDRVPGAIDAGGDFASAPTFFGALPTDISQDFFITGTGVTITVPVGALFLFVSASDSHYSDNDDPDGDFAISIVMAESSAAPEPAAMGLFGLGLLGIGAMLRRKAA